MMASKATLIVTLLLLAASNAAAQSADAVVVIRADFGGDRAGIGTGFFISPQGEILTAYHVIQGARAITVTHHGKLYKDVVVDRIAPDRDLATLIVSPLREPTPYLRLVSTLPAGIQQETLTIIGHPDGNLYQTLDVRMTTAGYRESGAVRVAGQAPVFRITNVKIIQLAGIVISGMSGAPVIAPEGVIGVLSGSRDEGGSLAWAIPAFYVNEPVMRNVGKRVAAITEWEALTLMQSRWKNLRHSVRLDDRMATTLANYFEALEDTRRALEQTLSDVESTVATSRIARLLAEERARVNRPFSAADSAVLETMVDRLQTLARSGNDWMAARGRVMNRLTELTLLLEGYVDIYPRTQRNDSIMDVFMRPLKRLEFRLLSADSGQTAFNNMLMPALMPILAAYSSGDDSPAAVAGALQKLEAALIKLADNDGRLLLGREAALLTEAGTLIERVLLASFDDPSTDWRWNSGLGYELMVPAGWETAGDAEDQAVIRNQLEAEGLVVDQVFGNKLSTQNDSSATSLLVIARRALFLPRDSIDSFERQLREAYGAAAVVERVDDPVSALIFRALLDLGERTILRCDAIIFGAAQTLVMKLSLPSNRHDLLPKCRATIESVVFQR